MLKDDKDYDKDQNVDTWLDILSKNLAEAFDKLASEKHFIPRKRCDPRWIDTELRHIYRKQEAVERRHYRTKNNDLWIEYPFLTKTEDECRIEPREHFLQNKVFEERVSKKNIWKELQSLVLLTKAKEGLHDFSPDEFITHFAGLTIPESKTEEGLITHVHTKTRV